MPDDQKQGEADEVNAKAQRTKLSAMKRKTKKAIERKATKLERLEIAYVKVDALRPNTYNPNRQNEHDFELLMRSMEEDGFTQPVVALRDGEIVDGEHRWRAAKQLGYDEIPVVFTDMTPAQMKIATLRHNRARGSEDVEQSAQVLRDLRELGALDWAQDSLMLDDVEMSRLLEDIGAPESLASEEFGEAWAPERGITSSDGYEVGVEVAAHDDGAGSINASAATTRAKEDIREREKRIAAAKTEEERQMASREMKLFRLSLTFAGEEATVIKRVLGKRSAERLLELCHAELDRQGLGEEPATAALETESEAQSSDSQEP